MVIPNNGKMFVLTVTYREKTLAFGPFMDPEIAKKYAAKVAVHVGNIKADVTEMYYPNIEEGV